MCSKNGGVRDPPLFCVVECDRQPIDWQRLGCAPRRGTVIAIPENVCGNLPEAEPLPSSVRPPAGPDPRLIIMRSTRKGFTLIELLIVVVIIGILAAIAIPKFQTTKGKAYASSIKSDLKNLTSVQEDYFYFNERYAPAMNLVSFDGTDGVTINIVEADGRGWSATATHPSAFPLTCAVYYGDAAPVAPAVVEGVINCQ